MRIDIGTGEHIIGRHRQPKGKELIRAAQQRGQAAYDIGETPTGLGVALGMALIGIVIALSPSYLEMTPASIFADAILSIAIAFWFWSTAGFIIELSDLRKFMSGINEEGWENLLDAFLLLIPAGTVYVALRIFEWLTWVELPLKSLSLLLFILGVVFLAVALDSFFI